MINSSKEGYGVRIFKRQEIGANVSGGIKDNLEDEDMLDYYQTVSGK